MCDVTGPTCSQNEPDLRNKVVNKLQLLSKIRGGVGIIIQTYNGNDISMEVDLDYDTIEVIKNKIEDKKGIAKESMLLVFKDETLDDGRNLRSYDIQANETIYLVSKATAASKTPKLGASVAPKDNNERPVEPRCRFL